MPWLAVLLGEIWKPHRGPKVLLFWVRALALVSRPSDRREYGATMPFLRPTRNRVSRWRVLAF